MNDDVGTPGAFYDSLATDYHLIFPDWWAAAERHAAIIESVLRREGVGPPGPVLDCSCGIGTQALSLAARGWEVVGRDISAAAIERAGDEARVRGLSVDLGVADMRAVDGTVDRRFPAVISCDNSLPHLLTDADLARALTSIRQTVADGGVFLASIRDYDTLLAEPPTGTTNQVYGEPGGRRIVGQAWEWDGELITIHLVIVQQQTREWTTTVRSTQYRALRRAVLTDAMAAAGFSDVRWREPESTGHYQLIVTARA